MTGRLVSVPTPRRSWPRRIAYRWRLYRAWVRQGRRRDRAVILRFGSAVPADGGWIIQDWHIDCRYWPSGQAVRFDVDTYLRVTGVTIGGYSLEEIAALHLRERSTAP